MKKLIIMLTICTIAIAGKVVAQGAGKVSTRDFSFLVEGVNKLVSSDGKETVQMVKRGEGVAEVVYIDPAGKRTKLMPAQGVIPGAPRADCNSRNPVQFYKSSTGTVGFFICTMDATATSLTTRYFKLDVLSMEKQPDGTSKAQNRRVEVKLSK